jgi:hypothetical protein
MLCDDDSTSDNYTIDSVCVCIAFENSRRHFVKTTQKLPVQAIVFGINQGWQG